MTQFPSIILNSWRYTLKSSSYFNKSKFLSTWCNISSTCWRDSHNSIQASECWVTKKLDFSKLQRNKWPMVSLSLWCKVSPTLPISSLLEWLHIFFNLITAEHCRKTPQLVWICATRKLLYLKVNSFTLHGTCSGQPLKTWVEVIRNNYGSLPRWPPTMKNRVLQTISAIKPAKKQNNLKQKNWYKRINFETLVLTSNIPSYLLFSAGLMDHVEVSKGGGTDGGGRSP